MISQSCHSCATTKCVPISSGSGSDSSGGSGSGGGSNAGAIAGGVIGGVAFVVIASFLVWWFFIRKRRQEHAQQAGPEKGNASADPRQSRKSAHSIASTVLTRASNVIQIAYIPGVTNRSPPETPNSLVPPVPPLPGAAPDQHFFMPGDLRDSTWSDMSDARTTADGRSIAPSLRSSVATTAYRSNAIVSPMPAQQAMRTRPAVVDVNGNSTAQPAHLAPPDAPAVPAITPSQLAKAGAAETNSSIVARGVMAKPVMVKGAQKNNDESSNSPAVQTIEEQTESSSSAPASRAAPESQFDHNKSAFDTNSSDEEDGSQSPGAKEPGSETQASTAARQSPFLDQPASEATGSTSALNRQSDSSRSAHRHRKSASSGFVMGKNDGSESSRNSKVPPRVESPFSDMNEVK
jgi:hypothetical protein